jgi:hypothetical protein
MALIFEEMVKEFWTALRKCNTLDSYILLLTDLEKKFVDYLHEIIDDKDKLDQFPFLAMISEVNRVCPKALIQISEKHEVFRAALMILKNYTKKDQDFLKNHFLSLKNFNVIHVNFSKRKNSFQRNKY